MQRYRSRRPQAKPFELLSSNAAMRAQLEELERKLARHDPGDC